MIKLASRITIQALRRITFMQFLRKAMMIHREHNDQEHALELLDGDIRVWIEQEAIHLVAFERQSHDPVELTSALARRLATTLNQLAAVLDGND